MWCVGAGGQQLAVSDADTPPDELELELVDVPVHGELIKTDDNTRMTTGNQKLAPPRPVSKNCIFFVAHRSLAADASHKTHVNRHFEVEVNQPSNYYV